MWRCTDTAHFSKWMLYNYSCPLGEIFLPIIYIYIQDPKSLVAKDWDVTKWPQLCRYHRQVDCRLKQLKWGLMDSLVNFQCLTLEGALHHPLKELLGPLFCI